MRFPGTDDYVTMNIEAHRYYDKDGREYQAASRFLEMFYEPFDIINISRAVGKQQGRSGEEVAAEWKQYGQERADEGTILHNAMERYEQTLQILPEDEKFRPAIISIASEYNEYYRKYQEQCLYDSEYLVAGTSDKILQCTSSKLSVIDIADYKNYTKGLPQIDVDKKGERRNKYMLHCLSHLIDSKYNRCCLQLSLYAYMLQKKTGCKIGKLFIHFIPPANPMGHYKVPLVYMKLEIEAILIHKKIVDSQKKEPVATTELFTFEEEFN